MTLKFITGKYKLLCDARFPGADRVPCSTPGLRLDAVDEETANGMAPDFGWEVTPAGARCPTCQQRGHVIPGQGQSS